MKLINFIFNGDSTRSHAIRLALYSFLSTFFLADLTKIISHPELFSAPMVLGATWVLTTINNMFASDVRN